MSLLSPSVLGVLVHFPHLDLTHARLSTFLRGSIVPGLWPLNANNANSIIYRENVQSAMPSREMFLGKSSKYVFPSLYFGGGSSV